MSIIWVQATLDVNATMEYVAFKFGPTHHPTMIRDANGVTYGVNRRAFKYTMDIAKAFCQGEPILFSQFIIYAFDFPTCIMLDVFMFWLNLHS